MSTINQDLQASYQIISLLERSKANSESIIDRLPDIFVVMGDNGKILKGNEQAALRLGVSLEDLLGLSVSRLFIVETWNLFSVYLKQAKELKADSKPIDFELPVDGRGAPARIYFWTITRLEGVSLNEGGLYCLIGHDITLLRAYQQQLAEIFASIPLGIITVNADGKIESTFSAYCQWLLGTDQIADSSLRTLLYEPAMPYLDAAGRESWSNLMNSTRSELMEFDMMSETFPKQFYFPLPGSFGEKGRHLGIKVQSIAHGTKVNGLLIILEDRTALVEAEKADEKQKLLQDMSLERMLQIKKCDQELLAVALNDLKQLFTQLADATFSKDSAGFLNILHGIKGNSRLAGFTTMMKLSHGLESRLKEASAGSGTFDWKIAFAHLDDVRAEWKEINSLARVMLEPAAEEGTKPEELEQAGAPPAPSRSLFQLFMDLQKAAGAPPQGMEATVEQLKKRIAEISYKPITTLENPLRKSAQTTANTLSKKVRLYFEWDSDLLIDESYLPQIRTCLMHIVNNGIDHGIETPEKREAAGKPLQGVIRINAYKAGGNRLVFTIEDDGGGLKADKIKTAAIKKRIVTIADMIEKTDEEVYQLIFMPGFSSAEKVTEVSGRGVGLSAVQEITTQLHGGVQVSPGREAGARFQFHIQTEDLGG